MARAKRKAPGEYSSHGPTTPLIAGVPSGQKCTPSGERMVLVPFVPRTKPSGNDRAYRAPSATSGAEGSADTAAGVVTASGA